MLKKIIQMFFGHRSPSQSPNTPRTIQPAHNPSFFNKQLPATLSVKHQNSHPKSWNKAEIPPTSEKLNPTTGEASMSKGRVR